MNKLLLTPLLAVALSGCINTDNLLKPATGVDEYYTFDSQQLRLCRGQSKNCYDLAVIVSDRLQLAPVEQAYGSQISGPNYPLQLAQTLINPPHGEYQAQPQGEDGRYYRLPINQQTDAVWQALGNAFDGLYNN